LLEDVAVAVQPEDAVAAACGEAVDEESGAAEEHGADASYALEAVVDVARGREELVLAHLDLLAVAEMDGEDMSRGIAGEADLAAPGRLRHEDLHARDHPLQGTLHRAQPDRHRRVLPEQDVMLEENRLVRSHIDRKDRHELAVDVVGDAGEGFG